MPSPIPEVVWNLSWIFMVGTWRPVWALPCTTAWPQRHEFCFLPVRTFWNARRNYWLQCVWKQLLQWKKFPGRAGREVTVASKCPQSLREDGLEWEVASGGQRWPPSVGQEPSQHCEGRKPISWTEPHPSAASSGTTDSSLGKIAPSSLRYLGSGQAEFAEKAASQTRARLTWCSPPVKGVYIAQQQKGPGHCSERWWEEVPVFHSDPVLVHLPFSQQGLFFSQSYGTLWNSSLVHDKRRPR